MHLFLSSGIQDLLQILEIHSSTILQVLQENFAGKQITFAAHNKMF